ncbi:MAG: sensor histidine kinase [Acidobacteria bacterium]|nr:sensor histidine kinase [Acidobacteriota bacterium]
MDEGGTGKIAAIEGRVIGARSGQQIVLFARSGAWYVQPLTDQPFTKIQPDSTWRNSTHLGTEYAALLVEPEYRPPAMTNVLPNKGGAVVAVAIVPGEVKIMVPVFWQTWWFRLSGGLACLLALLAFHRLRLRQLARQLTARFEERLDERMRIAQELQDTLLQGFLSASMQLHVAVEHLPEDSQEKLRLNRVQQLMGQVIEEGRNTVQGLRSITTDYLDLGQAFSRIRQELAVHNEIGEKIGFRVIVEGRPRSLHPIIRDEVYRIGREALANAFRHSRAKSIEVELKYAAGHLRILVRDDGCGMDPQSLRSGRDGHLGLSGMRERAERIGARLKVRSRATSGTEVELSVPGRVAFLHQPSIRPLRWFARMSPRRALARLRKR